VEEVVVPSINAEEGKNEDVELKEIKEPTSQVKENDVVETKTSGVDVNSEEYAAKMLELKNIIELERGHGQWQKQGFNFVIFMALFLVNIVRGSKKNPSMFGVETCSW
jgi:hypothetical protein